MKKTTILMPHKGVFYGYLVPLLTISLFIILTGITIFNVYYRSRADVGDIIASDVAQLATIFKRIDEACDILGFDSATNPINFLTIKKDGFVGSEVGSMNMAKPEGWQGPYVQDDLSVQGINYQVVQTRQGYFIVPGDGVKLPNGKYIGKDIILNGDADILSLMTSDDGLRYKSKPLAAQIEIRPRLFDAITAEELANAQREWVKQHRAGAQLAMS